jgi:hypothetical protein
MFASMLNPHFKCFDATKTFVGKAKMIKMVVKYDIMCLMPLLVAYFQFQNLGIIGHIGYGTTSGY